MGRVVLWRLWWIFRPPETVSPSWLQLWVGLLIASSEKSGIALPVAGRRDVSALHRHNHPPGSSANLLF